MDDIPTSLSHRMAAVQIGVGARPRSDERRHGNEQAAQGHCCGGDQRGGSGAHRLASLRGARTVSHFS